MLLQINRYLLTNLVLLFLLAGTAVSQDEFRKEGKKALTSENWSRLDALARARLEEDGNDLAAHAFLAFALAGQRKFDEAVSELKTIEEGGHSPVQPLAGLDAPLVKIINIIYMTCWANFDAKYNRKAWSALFNAFPDGTVMLVPASRLLMAALVLKDEAEAERFEAWFEAMLEQHAISHATVRRISHEFARGYLRAGVGSSRAVELASEAYRIAWETAESLHHRVEDPLEKREKNDVSCDHEYWDLALACSLAGKLDPPENPLAEREPEPGARFEDATEAAGLGKVNSGRVAAADYDGDGFTDLCFSGRLFKNMKGKTFSEVTKEAGITKTGSGAIFFDYDNDGCLDLLVTAQPHPRLFRGLGRKKAFRFEDVTQKAGLHNLEVGASPEGAAVMDIDNDGWLDFYMAVYENPFPKGHPDILARNNGDGTFSDVSDSSGIRAAGALVGRGVTCSDVDCDGDTDIHVSNYRLLANQLWQNDGTGKFSDTGLATGIRGTEQKGSFGHTIGSCWGDVDNDGHIDLFCANLAHPRFITQGFSNLSTLYIREGGENGGLSFSEERRARGIRFQETHSDPAFADYDNDGDLDLFITAIYVGAPSSFYQNDGDGNFDPVTFRTRSVVFNGWGQAWFDMDNDGDLDHVVGSSSGVTLHRNEGGGNNWLKVKLSGKKKNRFGVGARVKVVAPGGLTQVREMRAGRGTQSQDGYVLHFGLGKEKGKVKVEVLWPTGHKSSPTTRINRILDVKNHRDYPRSR